MTGVLRFTVARKPLKLCDGRCPDFVIEEVLLAVKKGREIVVNSDDAVDPNSDCWFMIKINYKVMVHPYVDHDYIITNGDEAYMWQRDLGKTVFIYTRSAQQALKDAIALYVEKL